MTFVRCRVTSAQTQERAIGLYKQRYRKLSLAAADIGAGQTCAFPEKPAIGRSRHFSQLDVAFRRGLVDSALPARYRHSRDLQTPGEVGLVKCHPVSQFLDLCGPTWFGKSCACSHRCLSPRPAGSAGVHLPGRSCSLQSVTIGDAVNISDNLSTRDTQTISSTARNCG